MQNQRGFELLSSISLCRDLPPGAVEKLARTLVPRQFANNHLIFSRGEPGQSLFVVETGRVRLARIREDGKSLMLAMVGPGDFFGELALLDGQPRSADALAAEDCRLHVLSRDAFKAILEEFPQASTAVIAILASRLRQADDLVEEAAFLDVPGRLAKKLLDLSRLGGNGLNRIADRPADDVLRVTHSQLADMIGVSRESVSKHMKRFERSGMIGRRERGIVILLPDNLKARAAI